jgi:hypothetical protein
VLRTILLVLGLVALFAAASAYAVKVVIINTVVSATAEIEPRVLPAHGGVPVELSNTTRLKTNDGSVLPPMRKMTFSFDKHGSIYTKGLPTCSLAKLAGTTVAVARKRCAGAIVGEGVGRAEVNLPGQARTEISSPLTFFNAPPEGGRPGLIAHAYETVPTAKTLLVPITIERVSQGRYGYRAEIEIPEIAAGYGSATLAEATLGKSWKRGGKTVGYLNAYCVGGRLQVYGTISLTDGSFFPGTLTSPCHVAG